MRFGYVFITIVLLAVGCLSTPVTEVSGDVNITVSNVSSTATTSTNQTIDGVTQVTEAITYTDQPSLLLYSYPKIIEVEQGSNKTLQLTAKNINNGNETVYNVTLGLTGLNNGWYSLSLKEYPQQNRLSSLPANSSIDFVIYLTIPPTASISEMNYVLTIAGVVDSTNVTDSKNGTLKITPNADARKMISELYNEYKERLEHLRNETTNLKKQGKDTVKAEQLADNAWQKLNETNAKINNNDYYNAFFLLKDAKQTLDLLEQEINRLKGLFGFTIDIFGIAGIIIGLIIIGILAYLFWPVSEEELKEHEFGAKPPREEKKKEPVTKQIEKILKKVCKYLKELFKVRMTR